MKKGRWDAPSRPVGRLEVEVEPPEQDLVRRQPEELLERLALVEQPVQLRMVLDVNLAEQSPPDDLPDQPKDEVFGPVRNVRRANVDDRAPDSLGRGDDNVVVLGDLERVERLGLALGHGRLVENSLVDRVRNRVVDELAQDQTV